MIQHADSALYLAKKSGGATLRFYSDAMTKEANARLELEAGIRRGLDCNEFVLQFNRSFRSKTERWSVLKRWCAGFRLLASFHRIS